MRYYDSLANFSTKLLLTACVLFSFDYLQICSSQEAPMDGAVKFQDVFYRTNFCDRQRQLSNGEVELRNVLKGVDLSVFIIDFSGRGTEEQLFHLSEDGTIPKVNPGIMAVILDELARRGGFFWRNGFGSGILDDKLDVNKTWTDLLQWSTDNFDVSVNAWDNANYRRAMGMSFPEFWYDQSIILVSKRSQRRSKFGSFVGPFTFSVWLLIGATILVTGMLYTLLMRFQENADERPLDSVSTMFLSALTFTGHWNFMVSTCTRSIFILIYIRRWCVLCCIFMMIFRTQLSLC